MSETFAYGVNTLDGECECPAVSAGLGEKLYPPNPLYYIADAYDIEARYAEARVPYSYPDGTRDDFAGHLSEADARRLWMAAMEEYASTVDDPVPAYHAGARVMKTLGWLEADDE